MISINFERDRLSEQLVPGAKVRVYWNFTRKCFSVQVRVLRNPHSGKHSSRRNKASFEWRVAGYADSLVLADVTFEISAAGQARCRKTRTKNVHSYVVGTLTGRKPQPNEEIAGLVAICRYNPYETDTFVAGRWCDAAGSPTDDESLQISYRQHPIYGAAEVGLLITRPDNKPAVLALGAIWEK